MAFPLAHDDPAHLGPYRLVARLGSGGMGTVYLGRSARGRTVALKTMHREIAAEAEFRTRFRLEADAARIIGGHHGAQVVDADPLADTPWLATEYVLGPPLDEAVALCGPLPEETVRAVGVRLCEALSQLHSSDVVHRDLKPSNILLAATGPKVIDFGIARAAGDDRLTRTGAAAGTPAFMSPEQATGREHTSAGDVFALAGVLVFACTGSGPFGTGTTADLLYRVRYAEPCLTRVPERLVPVLARCLDKDPGRRPDPAELAALLRDGATGAQGGDGEAEFADTLPDTVHAEILRRSAEVCAIRPARDEPPAGPQADEQRGDSASGPSRRRLVAFAGGGLVAAAAATGAWLWTRPTDDATTAPAPSSPPAAAARTAPSPRWQTLFDSVTVPVPLAAGQRLAVATVPANELLLLSTDGEEAGTLKDVRAAGGGDGRLYGIQGAEGELRPLDPRAGAFAEPLGAVHELLGSKATEPVSVLAAHRGIVVVRRGGFDPQQPCVALDGDTGRKRWRKKIPRETSVVATTDGLLVLAGALDEKVWALDIETGEEVWSRSFHLGFGRPLVTSGADTRGTLYLNLDEIVALRARDGKTLWRFGEGRKHTTDSQDYAAYGPPVARGGTVYALESRNGMVALDATSGKLRWELKTNIAARIPPDAVPVAGRRYLYFPSAGTALVTAVDPAARAVRWTSAGKRKELAPRLLAHRRSGQLVVATDRRVFALPLT